MDGLEAYNLVKNNNTLINRQLFVYYHRPYLAKIIIKRTVILNEQDFEDLLSQVYIQVLSNINNIDFTQPYYKIRGYIGTIATTQLLRNNRDANAFKRLHHKLYLDFEDDRTIDNIAQNEKLESKIEFIHNIASGQIKQIINMILQGFTIDEIAEVYNCSHQWIWWKLKDFGKKIKKEYLKEK